MYNKIILNIFNNPKNAGRLVKPEGIADCYNEDGTIHVEFSLRIENGIIIDSKFRAQANPYYVAVCSVIASMLKGKMVSFVFLDQYSIRKELQDDTDNDIEFCIECVRMAIQDYKEKLEKLEKEEKEGKE